MKNVWITRAQTLLMQLFIFGLLLSCSKEEIEQDIIEIEGKEIITDKDLIEGSYIVIVSDEPAEKDSKAAGFLEQLTNEINKKPGASVKHSYKHAITGFAAKLSDKQVQELAKDPRVKYIEQDGYIYMTNTVNVQEYCTWGLDRIDQRTSVLDRAFVSTATGIGVTAYIMDSGIRYSHNEFEGRAALGYDFVVSNDPNDTDPNQQPGEDCMGHGTHVAGTVGGKLFGVAKNINLVSVRVFGCTNISSRSIYVAAIDWITNNAVHPAVVNMSLGFTNDPENQLATKAAIENSIASGINYVVSAGNDNGDACLKTPANSPGALTVGATEIGDKRAYFSNYGDCVDLYAPGAKITSASYEDDSSTFVLNGTSMSAPHVTGLVGLYLEKNPAATPAQVHAAIIENTTSNAVTDVPSGPNNIAYSLWEPVEFTPPTPPALNLTAVGEKIRGINYVNLSWNSTDAPYIKVYQDGVAHFPEHMNDGEQQISTGSREKDVTFIFMICEGIYNTCSEEVRVIFGNGSDGGTNEAPKANFTYNTNLLQVQFTDSSTDADGSVTNWNWNFGDGNTSTTKDPVHSYAAAGTYEVSLTVTDDGGNTGSTIKSVVVSSEEPDPGILSLSATGYKVKGVWHTDLSWNYSGTVDIYRDGKIVNTINSSSGTYTDVTGLKGGGSLTYKICEAGSTANCSNTVTVQF